MLAHSHDASMAGARSIARRWKWWAAHFRGERIALCGDARGLARVFQQVSGLLPGLKLDREPPTVVAPPTPPGSPAKAARRA
jgi:hypothetical protein